MEKTHQPPISVMIKERRLRWLGHAARRSDNNVVKQLLFATRIPGHVLHAERGPHGYSLITACSERPIWLQPHDCMQLEAHMATAS